MNQRVVSSTITFHQPAVLIQLTPITIDGIDVNKDFAKPVQKIEVSRVFRYQEQQSKERQNLNESAVSQKHTLKVADWIE